MAKRGLRLTGIVVSAALAASLIAATPAAVLANGGGGDHHGGGNYRCTDGSIPAGTYRSITVTGVCHLDLGDVTVWGSLVIAKNGALEAAFAGSDLTVKGNVVVNKHAALALGCEPVAFPCFNDPTGTLSAKAWIGGSLTAEKAWVLIVHNTRVGRNIVVEGGGGGLTCAPTPFDSPAYATFEDVTVGRNLSITGWRSCWLGVIRTKVHGNLVFVNNVVLDPDGNEVVSNTIGHNLICWGNSPAPQVGDSAGNLNTVHGRATGQCKGLVS